MPRAAVYCIRPKPHLFSSLSFGPLLEWNVSTRLASLFGQLCVSSMWAATHKESHDSLATGNTPRAVDKTCDHTPHCDQELLSHCLRLTYQIMSISPAVLEAVIHLFGNIIVSPNSAGTYMKWTSCPQTLMRGEEGGEGMVWE